MMKRNCMYVYGVCFCLTFLPFTAPSLDKYQQLPLGPPEEDSKELDKLVRVLSSSECV